MNFAKPFRNLLVAFLIAAISASSLITGSAQANPTDLWKISDANFKKDTAGYLIPNSVMPGEKVKIYATCPKGTFTLQIFKMGYFDGVGAQLVSTSSSLPCISQTPATVDDITNMHENHWKLSTTVDTKDLAPGFYLIRITSSHGHQSFMNLVVRDQSRVGRMVISIPTLTDAAYNAWNGVDAYGNPYHFANRARVISLDQPNSESFGTGKYLLNIQPLVELADKLDLNPSFVTDVDIATRPKLLAGAVTFVSGGHDEYWTLEERQAVLKARESGTNLLFFGANVEYWRVRLSDSPLGSNRRMDIYKKRSEDPNTSAPTTRFRNLNLPEQVLTGQMYRCFPATGLFTIAKPNLFIFQGLNLHLGDTFAGILGPEVDNAPIPNSFDGKYVLAAKSPVTCGRYKEKPNAYSSFFYGVSPSGAGTISVGTMDWVTRGLTKEVPGDSYKLVLQTTTNILQESSLGPLGQLHPIN